MGVVGDNNHIFWGGISEKIWAGGLCLTFRSNVDRGIVRGGDSSCGRSYGKTPLL